MRFPRRWAIAALGALHIAALIWLAGDPARRREMFFDSASVPAATLDGSPESLLALGYVQDDPREVARFRKRAEEAVAGAESDLARVRLLSDAIYSLQRPGARDLGPYDALTLTDVADALEAGGDSQCGHRTWMLTGMARSIGIDVRQIVWARRDGSVGHISLEFYSRDEQRWIYFDLNLNGYATTDGRALSAAELRARGAASAGTRLVSNSALRRWDEGAFARVHGAHEFDWYLMSNQLQPFERGTRFGRLHAAYGLLTRLPNSAQRVADYFLTGRQTRLAIDGHANKTALPSWALRALAMYLSMAAALFAFAAFVRLRKQTGALEAPDPAVVAAS